MVESFLLALPVGGLILAPSLVLLYSTFSREVLGSGEPGEGVAGHG